MLGQKVLQKSTTDPRLITTLETQNALNRTSKVELLDSDGSHIACHELIHDPQGNLLYRRDHIYENAYFQNTQTIQYTYTSDHQIESLTRGFGTPESRLITYSYLPSGKIATKTLPDGVTLTYSYHPLGFMNRIDSSDGTVRHAFDYNLLGHLQLALDEKQNIEISRQLDPSGNVLQEIFPYGFEVQKDYDDFNRLLSLKMGSQGSVSYTYDPLFLRTISRISSEGNELYRHSYEEYDQDGNLVLENLIGDLGQITHKTDSKGQEILISSPYFSEKYEYDAVGNPIRILTENTENHYSYDALSQLSSEKNQEHSLTYVHDSLYNRTQKNGISHEINQLNELLSIANAHCAYDLNGNLISKKTPSETFYFVYDPLHRLIEASSEKQKIHFVYDPLGRRLSKAVFSKTDNEWEKTHHEYYLYHGQNEIGAFTSPENPINIRVLGLDKYKDSPLTVGVEIEGQTTAPLIDIQGNIRGLVALNSESLPHFYEFTAFGEEKPGTSNPRLFNPWRFASKRFDTELGLIYFGKRYYDPLLGRWLTTDPAGFADSSNLYQYVFNNPFRYRDPDGQFIMALPLLALTWKVIAVSAVTACLAYELECLSERKHASSAFERGFNLAVHQVVQNMGGISQYAMQRKKKGGVDDTLSKDPLNDPNLEDISHPEAKEKGHYQFKDKKSGEIVHHDKGKPDASGHEGHNHLS